MEEASAIALEALCEAALTFDEERGLAFSTFAYKAIDNKFNNVIRNSETKKRKAVVISLQSNVKNRDTSIEDFFGTYDRYLFIWQDLVQRGVKNNTEYKMMVYRFWHKYQHKEIGEALGLTERQVYLMGVRVLNRLKKQNMARGRSHG